MKRIITPLLILLVNVQTLAETPSDAKAAELNDSSALAIRAQLYELSQIATGFFMNNHCSTLSDDEVSQFETDLNLINGYLFEELGGSSHSLSAIQRTAFSAANDLALKGCSNIGDMSTQAMNNAHVWAQQIDSE